MSTRVLALFGSCLLLACQGGDVSSEIDGNWTWKGDGGCAGGGERISIGAGRISWTAADGSKLGSSAVAVQSGFDEVDRMRRWISIDYTRDTRRFEDRFQVTDRLGTPVFQLESRRINDVFEDEFSHDGDRLVPCDG